MPHAAEITALAEMSEADVTVIAYIEAAGGDAGKALRYAVEDLLEAEARLSVAVQSVSHGFVRGELMPAPR